MSKRIVTVISQLTEKQKERLLKAARRNGCEILFFDTAEAAIPALQEAEILFAGDGFLLKSAPKLRWVCTPSAGVNQFLSPGLMPGEGLVLTNSSGAYGVTISEHIIMQLLELLRRQQDYRRILMRREWTRDLTVRSIFGSRITLLGTGNIGQETSRRLRSFGPKTLLGLNRSGKAPAGLFDAVLPASEIEAVLPDTDILIISLPGTKETYRLLNESRLQLMPDGAVVVNVGRGSIIEQNALEKELRSGRLFAALDVFEKEPLPPEDSLWDCPNLVISPHAAGNMSLGYTVDRIVDLFIENLDRYCAGLPMERIVSPEKGY